MNQNFFESNPCYEPNSSSFDQYQPSQSFVTQQNPQRSNKDIQLEKAKLIKNNRILLNENIFPHEEASMEVLLAKKRILKLIQAWDDKQIESWSLPALLLQLLKDSRTIDQMLKKQHSIQYKEYLKNSSNTITTVLPTEEPEYSLSMGDKHPSTILKMESDEVIKSRSKNIVPISSEYEEFSGELMPTSIIDEEIDVFTDTDDLMPPGSKNDDYYSEWDIHIFEELLSNDTPPIPENESSNFDHHDDPSFPCPPPEPPDVEIFFESNSGVLTTNVGKDIFEHYVLMPNILPTLPTFDPLYQCMTLCSRIH
nr:hypothetical protein [Tanacetum cinerariifolium]